MTDTIVSLGALLSLLLSSAAVDSDHYSPNSRFDDCGRTCSVAEGTCGDVGQRNLLCRCDGECEIFGDCCENVSTCAAAKMNTTISTVRLDRDLLECRSIFLDPRTKPDWMQSFLMVSACPAGWLAGRDNQLLLDTLGNCTGGSENLPPVTDLRSGLVYKNEYCAVCHEVENFQPWAYQFECSPALRDAVQLPYFQLTAEIVEQACLPCAFSAPPLTGTTLPPPRACLHNSLLDNRCLEREELLTLTDVSLEEEQYQNIVSLCQSGPVAPLVLGIPQPHLIFGGTFVEVRFSEFPFRNQYCALCNGIRVSTELMSCVDPYLVRNSTNYCREAAINLKFVIPPPPTTAPPPPMTPPITPDPNSTDLFFIRPPEAFIVVNRPAPGPPAPFTIFLDVNGDSQDKRSGVVSVDVGVSCSDGQVYDWITQRCRNTLCPESTRGETCAIVQNIMLIGTSNDLNVSISCEGSLITLETSEVTLLDDNKTLLFGEEMFDIAGDLNGLPVICTNVSISCEGSLITLKTSEVTLLDDNKTLLFGEEIFDIEGNLNGLPVICTSDSISCEGSLIMLETSEFTLLDGNKTLLFGEEMFDIEGYLNGLPIICTNFTQNGTREENRTVIFYSYPAAFSIVTYIGCSLSVIGCSFVLLTYTIFRELQTLPGKILMNLAAAILATCVFLLIGIPLFSLSEKDELCHTTAIVLHWLILSQFSWMSVMSYELARTLIRATHLKLTQTKSAQRNIFLLYLLIGWGLPTLFTGLCTIVNYTTDYVQYGEEGFCWIGHTVSFYIVMLMPVALLIVLNSITFGVTTFLLCKAQRGQAKLQKQKNTSYMRIYASVFSVTGLTWVFGFGAILARDDWAWYLFVILTSTQGFTICVSFLFTQKVASLYKDYFWPKISGKFSLKSWSKPITQDTSMAVRYTKKGENVSTVSNGFNSVESGPPTKDQVTLTVAEQEMVSNAKHEDGDGDVERGTS